MERNVADLSVWREAKVGLYFPLEMPEGTHLPVVVWILSGAGNGGWRDAGREINVCGTFARNGGVTLAPMISTGLSDWSSAEVLSTEVTYDGGEWELVEIEVAFPPTGLSFSGSKPWPSERLHSPGSRHQGPRVSPSVSGGRK